MNYANFGQRFGAILVDTLVLLPLAVVDVWLRSTSKTVAFIIVIPMTAAFCAYSLYLHARSGQTIGKRVMNIRVVKVSGARIGWRESWLRSSVDISFAVLGVIASLVALATISDADFYGVGWKQQTQNLLAHQPAWLAWTVTASQIWVWSELIVMLLNKRRRSLHDFIAGTVVVSEEKLPQLQQQMVAPLQTL